MASSAPLVSIVLVCWNSAATLPRCLDCLTAQTCRDFEVIIIDNGSSDGATQRLEQTYPGLKLQIRRLEANLGFSFANNLGAGLARGKWLALLNTDAFAEADWLEQLLQAAESEPAYSFFASRQIQARTPELLDGAGDALHVSGLAWRRYYDYPSRQFGLVQEEVFSACGAAALYSREAFLRAGGFDVDFFSYHEDVDLSFRLHLLGYRCLYVANAIVNHVGSASTGNLSDFVLYHGLRNYVWSFFKNMPAGLLWEALPAHLMANLNNLIGFSRRGHGTIVVKAKIDALRGIAPVLQKRREIQRTRTVRDAELSRIMEHGLLQPYMLRHEARRARSEFLSPRPDGPTTR